MFFSFRSPGWRTAVLTTSLWLAGSTYASAQAPTKQWDKTFGGRADDYLTALQPTPDGGYLLAGYSASGSSGDKTQTSQGLEDYWVIKLDASGHKQWDHAFGGSSHEYGSSLLLTPDGGYLVAGTSFSGLSGDKTQPNHTYSSDSDFWLVKLDATGKKQWDKTVGGSEREELATVLVTSDGGYLVGGSSESGVSGDKTQRNHGSSYDFWLVKLEANGQQQWDKTFGGGDTDFLTSMQTTPDGGYIVGGFSRSGSDGDKTQASQGAADYWVIKLDAQGAKEWDQGVGGAQVDNLRVVQPTRDGGYILGGESRSTRSGDKTQPNWGEADYWVVKLDAQGHMQWDRSFGGVADDLLKAIQLTPDGGYLVGGASWSGLSGTKTQAGVGAGSWLIQLDAEGN